MTTTCRSWTRGCCPSAAAEIIAPDVAGADVAPDRAAADVAPDRAAADVATACGAEVLSGMSAPLMLGSTPPDSLITTVSITVETSGTGVSADCTAASSSLCYCVCPDGPASSHTYY